MNIKWSKKDPTKIDIATYEYLKSIPKDLLNLFQLTAIRTYEEKYPEFKA